MNTTCLYDVLVLWINFVIVALPPRTIASYVELLIGTIISGSGHITDALFEVGHQKNYSTYYYMLEQGKWAWLYVTKQFIRLITTFFSRVQWNFIVDDFVCPRSSKNAPGANWHHEHAQKPNRTKYIWGQQWVALGLSLTWGKMSISLPLLLRLHKKVGNSSKITRAVSLIKLVLPWFNKTGKETFRCLVDAWYMKRTFILVLLEKGVHAIGQVRKDTALFKQPVKIAASARKRGAPKKYGNKLTQHEVEKLPLHKANLNIYGGCKQVTYRSSNCIARFLKALPVIAVWCKLPDKKDWILILSTDLSLTTEQIIKFYARRWKIEPMFNEIKHSFGLIRAWEQTSQTLHRWVSMLCISYSLNRLLSVIAQASKNQNFVPFIQWRVNKPLTAGLVRKSLIFFFRHFSFLQLWEPKSKKLLLPTQLKNYNKWKNLSHLNKFI
jgi:hypothetical protein